MHAAVVAAVLALVPPLSLTPSRASCPRHALVAHSSLLRASVVATELADGAKVEVAEQTPPAEATPKGGKGGKGMGKGKGKG